MAAGQELRSGACGLERQEHMLQCANGDAAHALVQYTHTHTHTRTERHTHTHTHVHTCSCSYANLYALAHVKQAQNTNTQYMSSLEQLLSQPFIKQEASTFSGPAIGVH